MLFEVLLRMEKFDFETEYVLEDDFVRLEPLKLEHVDQLLDIANEPNIWDYSFSKGTGREALTAYVQSTIDARKEKKEYPFLVIDKKTNRAAGSTRFYDISLALKSIRVGYTWYGTEFRGTGLNDHCKYLLFNFAFDHSGFERIGMGAYAENKRSIAAMKKIGCEEEGTFRGFFPAVSGKKRQDAILLSILKNEWSEGKKEALKNRLRIAEKS